MKRIEEWIGVPLEQPARDTILQDLQTVSYKTGEERTRGRGEKDGLDTITSPYLKLQRHKTLTKLPNDPCT